MEKLQWENAYEWKSAPREPVVVDNVIEGYVKAYGNLKMYWINRAGHMVNNLSRNNLFVISISNN